MSWCVCTFLYVFVPALLFLLLAPLLFLFCLFFTFCVVNVGDYNVPSEVL